MATPYECENILIKKLEEHPTKAQPRQQTINAENTSHRNRNADGLQQKADTRVLLFPKASPLETCASMSHENPL